MKTENVFTMSKSYLETAFKNFELFQSLNEKMMKLFLGQLEQENTKLDRNYNQWLGDTQKAFSDYRDLMTKGLDYLSDCLEKSEKSNGNPAKP